MFLAVFLLLTVAVPVLATDAPDSVALEDIWANRNLLETGDLLIHFKYNVEYATPPAENIQQAFIFRLFDAANTVELGSRLAYPFHDDGYGFGTVAFYFDADSSPGWGTAYFIRVEGNPVYFSTPFSQSFQMTASNYSTFSTKDANVAELKDRIISLTQDLQVAWSVLLLDEVDIGTVFSTSGELYFRNSIPGLQVICPDLFYVQVQDLEYTSVVHDNTYAGTIEARFDGTWVGTSLEGLGGLFGTSTQLIGVGIMVVLCIIVVAVSARHLASINSGLMDCLTVVILCGAFSLIPFGLMSLIIFLLYAYLGWLVIYRR